MLDRKTIIEEMAKSIYADSYTEYGTCSDVHWSRTSEVQREFMRRAAECALDKLNKLGYNI